MSSVAPADQQPFSINMLWRDERYRSSVIQIVTLMIVMLGFAWLVSNTVQNLAAMGKTFNFGFLANSAGYDINQTLIPYENQDTNARAALVGMLNTLLVAIMGCATATVVGVIAGVLRLSKNFLVGRLMTVYVEGFRNVPVLLWILLIMAVVNESLPPPSGYRGDAGLDAGAVVITNRGFYVPAPIYGDGSAILLIVAALAIVGAVLFRRYAKRHQDATGLELPPLPAAANIAVAGTVAAIGGIAVGALANALLEFSALGAGRTTVAAATVLAIAASLALARWAAAAQVAAIMIVGLVVPPVLAFYLLGQPITLEFPTLQGFNFRGGVFMRDSLIALWLALSLYTGAFVAEIVRSGILSVSKGQTEAASALGLRPNITMRLVVLPQALRVIVPPLISQYLNLTKNSSLAIAVGYMDATGTLGGITLNQTGREMESILLLMAFYLLLSLCISAIMNAYNARVTLVER